MEGSQDAIIQAVSFPNVSVHMLELNRGHCTNIRNHGSRSYQAKPHSLGTAIKSTYTDRNPRLPQACNFLSRDPAAHRNQAVVLELLERLGHGERVGALLSREGADRWQHLPFGKFPVEDRGGNDARASPVHQVGVRDAAGDRFHGRRDCTMDIEEDSLADRGCLGARLTC